MSNMIISAPDHRTRCACDECFEFFHRKDLIRLNNGREVCRWCEEIILQEEEDYGFHVLEAMHYEEIINEESDLCLQ